MKKIFSKRPQVTTRPTPLAPPSDDAPTTPTQTQATRMPHSTAKSLPMLPNHRPTVEAAFQTQSPATPASGGGRPSFQQQRTPRQPSSRSTSGDDVQPVESHLKRDSAWVVVEPTQSVLQPQSQSNNGNGNGGEYVRMVLGTPTAQAFESRSSLSSLPPGASPPLPYPDQSAPPPSSPFAAAPPPSSQQAPSSHPPPAPGTLARRTEPIRRLSDGGGIVGSHGPHVTAVNGGPLTGSTEKLYESSELSSGPENKEMRDRLPEREKEKHWKGIFGWAADRDKQKAQAQQINPYVNPSMPPDPNGGGQRWDITRTVGYVTATGSEDWTLLLDVCERASTDSGAKEAAKALRNEFKYAEPGPMLSAARLWAIMLRNCQAPFIQQSSSKKFIETVEDTVYNHTTSPVVRERLLMIIAGASYQYGDRYPAFRALWKKVKPKNAPSTGIAFDPTDAMFSPPARRLPKPGSISDGMNGGRPQSMVNVNVNIVTGPISPPGTQTPYNDDPSIQQTLGAPPPRSDSRDAWQNTTEDRRNAERLAARRESLRKIQGRPPPPPPPIQTKSSTRGIISPEEDMRRLFEECEIAKSQAHMLSNALVYARPEEILQGQGVAPEFHAQCVRSKEIIETQIPWATAGADKSRTEQQQQQAQRRNPSTVTPPAVTIEEQLLASLLQANLELTDVLKEYDEILKLGAAEREEREVKERSKKEMRLDPRQIQYYGPDGSVLVAPQGSGGGPSRSPSPSLHSPVPSRAQHPLPTPPSSVSSNVALNTPQLTSNGAHMALGALQQQHPNGSVHTLAPPPPAPHGPRRPSGNGGRSRSPSPDGARRSTESPRPGGLLGTAIERTTSSGGRTMESLKRGMSKLGLDVHRTRSQSRGDKNRKSSEVDRSREREVPMGSATPEERDVNDDEVVRTPIQPSSKALGKRKAGPYAEDESFDTDDLFRERIGTPLGHDDGLLHSDSDSLLDDYGSSNPRKPVVYAYDAAAEKEKERQKQLDSEASALGTVH